MECLQVEVSLAKEQGDRSLPRVHKLHQECAIFWSVWLPVNPFRLLVLLTELPQLIPDVLLQHCLYVVDQAIVARHYLIGLKIQSEEP
uniref:Predicted protein n=1 Tax=Hordeum vulgare subsp. vulgare TaxID=112509 RepID=F2DKE5_HORVV|nr:predicted protein [Hordeum vulgare subsp. vulgare]